MPRIYTSVFAFACEYYYSFGTLTEFEEKLRVYIQRETPTDNLKILAHHIILNGT